ncbi:MAG: metal-binding protein [Clostridia bacterium]|nr:metal-binding protein [Clostridia bacterium]
MKMYKLIGPDGKTYLSETPGLYGGYNGKEKIYGALDCPSALNWIAKGYYVDRRVFFKDEKDALLAGFRPCAVCLRKKYLKWKADPEGYKESILKTKDIEKSL